MQNIIKKIVWGCLLIIPFVALHVADGGFFDVFSWFGQGGMFFPFISGKNLLFRILVAIAFAGWAILALYDTKYRISFKKSPILLAYSSFIAVLFFADLLGVSSEKSFWSNFERMEGFVGHFHLFVYFFVLIAMVISLEEWRKMWKFFVVANVLVLIQGFAQLFGSSKFLLAKISPETATWFATRFQFHTGGDRVDATLGNSAYFGIFCLMFAFILALLWSQTKDVLHRRMYVALIVLNVLSVFYSGTRGSMIGLAFGALLSFAIIAWNGSKNLKKWFAVIVASLVLLTSAIFILKETPLVKGSPVLSRIATISPNDVTGASRLSMWTISFDAWKERPILGYGQDNFGHVFARKFMPEEMCNLEPWYDRSHNVFFDWLVAAGILGLISYLSLYVVTLWYMWRKDNEMPLFEKALLTGLLVGYFIHNFFVFDNLVSYILFFAVLAYITVRTKGGHRSTGQPILGNDQMTLLAIPVIGLSLLVVLYYVDYRPLTANRLVIKAMSVGEYAKTMPFADAVKMQQDAFTQAIAMNTLGSLEAREQFLQMAVRMGQITIPDTIPAADRQAAVSAINSLLQEARKDVQASYEANKEDVRMLSIYGMFLNGIGDSQSAEQVLTQARLFAPNKQLLAYDLVRAYLIQKKYGEAYTLSKELYDKGINCRDAVTWYMLSAAYAGKFEEAQQYVLSKGQNVTLSIDLINGVFASGQMQLGVKLLEEFKVLNPSMAPQIDAYLKQFVAPKK